MREPTMTASFVRRAFTLVELLIAVVVLLVVILAVGRIFSTAGQVTAYGQATADLLQEARAIENQMRRDFARISKEGFLAIQCVEVRNDVNFAESGQLLDASKDPDYVFRADRLLVDLLVVAGDRLAQLVERADERGLVALDRALDLDDPAYPAS
ncbi:MAG: prepilin-type N-terminal cleavage/methylation domain-containing protein, partial [Phycisphaerales bacterium]